MSHQRLAQQGVGFDDSRIGGQGHGGADAGNALIGQASLAHMMGVEEPYEGVAACLLHRCQAGPLLEEVAKQHGVFVSKPLKYLGIMVFQGGGQAVGNALGLVDEQPPRGNQLLEFAQRWTLGLQSGEGVAMA